MQVEDLDPLEMFMLGGVEAAPEAVSDGFLACYTEHYEPFG